MTIANVWLVEGHILSVVVSGRLTDTDLQDSIAQCKALVRASNTDLVHTLIDLREMDGNSLVSLNPARLAQALNHPRQGWTAVVYSNRLAAFVADRLSKLQHVDIRSFVSLTDALEFLQHETGLSALDIPHVEDYEAYASTVRAPFSTSTATP